MGVSRRFERILLATDGSDDARAAVDATIALAKSPTVKVRVVQVWNLEIRHRHGSGDVEVRGEAGKLVDATVEQLFRAGVIAEREICRADSTHVAAAIACAAKVFEADLVVIGSRGLSDWQTLSVNSDTNQMLCGLDCPVVIVRGVEAALRSRAGRYCSRSRRATTWNQACGRQSQLGALTSLWWSCMLPRPSPEFIDSPTSNPAMRSARRWRKPANCSAKPG